MGPGNSIQRNYLPHPYSDFVYATIIEEYGLIGGVVILMLYLFILFRVGMIVRKCERTFPAFLSIGLAFSLVFQAMINMAVAVNLFPVTVKPYHL
jgi:cell division protein FtsW